MSNGNDCRCIRNFHHLSKNLDFKEKFKHQRLPKVRLSGVFRGGGDVLKQKGSIKTMVYRCLRLPCPKGQPVKVQTTGHLNCLPVWIVFRVELEILVEHWKMLFIPLNDTFHQATKYLSYIKIEQ